MMTQTNTFKLTEDWQYRLPYAARFDQVNDSCIQFHSSLTDAFDDEYTLLIKLQPTAYVVTDQGYTIWNLQAKGFQFYKLDYLSKQRIKNFLNINQIVLSLANDELSKTVFTSKDVPGALNAVLSAMIKISNIYCRNF